MSELVERQESTAVSMFERLAKDPNVDVDKLERLMQMNERMLSLSAKQQFDAAFADMQSEIPSITEKGEIKHGEKIISTYGKFEDINDVVKPILQKHGFAVSFRPKVEDKMLIVTGILSHRAGHREEASLSLPFDTSGAKNSVQAIGSSASYGKRYVMEALLNITTRGLDDDGAGTVECIDENQIGELEVLIKDVGADRPKFLKFLKIGSLSELPKASYATAISMLEAKRQKGGGRREAASE